MRTNTPGILLALLLCASSAAAQEVREDDAGRFNLFMTALSACGRSDASRWHVLCVLEQVSSAELHIARMHALDLQVGVYLLNELSQLEAVRHTESYPEAWTGSQHFKALSGGIAMGLKGLQHRVARIGIQRRRTRSRRPSSRPRTPSTSQALSRTLLASGTPRS